MPGRTLLVRVVPQTDCRLGCCQFAETKKITELCKSVILYGDDLFLFYWKIKIGIRVRLVF